MDYETGRFLAGWFLKYPETLHTAHKVLKSYNICNGCNITGFSKEPVNGHISDLTKIPLKSDIFITQAMSNKKKRPNNFVLTKLSDLM